MSQQFLRLRLVLWESLLRSLSSWRFLAASTFALIGLVLVRVGGLDRAVWPLLVIGPYLLVAATAPMTMRVPLRKGEQQTQLAPSLRRWLARRRLAALRGPFTRAGRVTALLFLLLALIGTSSVIVYSWRQATPADLPGVLVLLPSILLAAGTLIEALDKVLVRLEQWTRRLRDPSPGTPTRDLQEALSQILNTLDWLLRRGSTLFQPQPVSGEVEIMRLLRQELPAFIPRYKQLMRHDFLAQTDELCRHLNSMLNTLGGVLRDLDHLEGARRQYERAWRLCEALLGPDDADTLQSHRLLAAVSEKPKERR
jgi:Tetratricopeptide repeat